MLSARLMFLAASAAALAGGAASLSCRELDIPSKNAVADLAPPSPPPSAASSCSGDLFRCSAAAQTCLNSARRCAGGCDAAGCVPFGSVCDSRDDCAALAGGRASADEEHCADILRTYRRTPRTSINVGRFKAFQVSLKTCAAYCFFHESCSMFSYAVTGNRQCKIGCHSCGWETLAHEQSNAVLYNASADTALLRARLAAGRAGPSAAGGGPVPLPLPAVCGQRNVVGPDTARFELALYGAFLGEDGVGPRLAPADQLRVVGTGDRRATYGEYPWTAQLQLLQSRPPRYQHHCGASIVDRRYVVTAAHCLEHAERDYQVKVGQFDRLRLDDDEATFGVQEVIRHPGYVSSAQNSSGYPDDIAIIKLKLRRGEGIVFSEKVQPVCLRSALPEEPPHSCLISGWGHTTSGGALADLLAGSPVPLVSDGFCASRDGYGATFDAGRQLCAGELLGGVDTCQGDSGGPLACFDSASEPAHWYLAGVVSYGRGCGQPLKPGVYTHVTAYYDWIVSTINYLESV